MKRFLKYFASIVFAVTVFNASAQTYLQPTIGMALNKVSNNEINAIVYSLLDKKVVDSYSCGFEVNQEFKDKIQLGLILKYEKLFVSSNGATVLEIGDFKDIDFFERITTIVHNRLHTGIGLTYRMTTNWKLSSKLLYIATPTVKHKQNGNKEKEVVVPQKKEREAALNFGLSYISSKRLTFSFFYQGVFWQNNQFSSDDLDPVHSFGIELGYQIKVLDKFKKKSKVNCPKL